MTTDHLTPSEREIAARLTDDLWLRAHRNGFPIKDIENLYMDCRTLLEALSKEREKSTDMPCGHKKANLYAGTEIWDGCPICAMMRGVGTRIVSLEAELAALDEIYHTAQGLLTGLNVGNIEQESPIHKHLRKTLIAYREKING